jgi:epimerase transport system membrane fusion protein
MNPAATLTTPLPTADTASARTAPPPAPGDDRLRRVGLAVVLVLLGGFGAWAALAPLSSAALGNGVITVEGYRKTVQHLEGGIVAAMAVRDGDAVQAGQELLRLEDTPARAQLEVLRGELFQATARAARLEAQRDGRLRIDFPLALQAEAARDARAAEAVRVQQQLFTARRRARDGEAALYEQQVAVLQSKARGLQAQLASREALVLSYGAEREDYAALAAEGYAERQRVREMERHEAQSLGLRGELAADLAATDLQVAETRLKIVQLDRELQREVAKELAEAQAELFALREKQRALDDTLARTVVRAPAAGTVLGLAVHTVGAVVRPGDRLLDIVPQAEKLVVEAQLSPRDIDQVRVGQSAEVRFPAFGTRRLPRLEGRVVAVSADRLVDDTAGQKLPYYLGRVELSGQGLQALAEARLELRPGMPAEVLVQTGERTLLQYLMAPLRDMGARALKEE